VFALVLLSQVCGKNSQLKEDHQKVCFFKRVITCSFWHTTHTITHSPFHHT